MKNQNKFYPELSESFDLLIKSSVGKNIAIIGHMRPDGDCIGSQIALASVMRDAGAKNVICLNKHEVPSLYTKYAEGETFISADDFNDLSYEIIAVDCADYSRTSEFIKEKFPIPLCAIDHHINDTKYAKINLICQTSSATCELIAGMLFDANIKINKKIANALYVGMVMDTRQFTTNSTSAKTFEIAAELAKAGANIAQVAIDLYQRERYAKVKLLSCYLNSIELYSNNKICGGVLYMKDFAECGALKEDSDGLVDYARAIDNVEASFLIEELPTGAKASLRCKDPKYAMNLVAQNFGGGGHACASGCNSTMNVEDFKKALVAKISEALKI